MSLDDILKAGKKDFEVKTLLQKFRENPTINLASALNELGDEGKEAVREYGEENFISSTPAQLNIYLDGVSSMRQERLVKKVQENPDEAISAFDNHVEILLGIKPVSYEGINENIEKKHKKAHKIAQNPEGAYDDFIKEAEASKNDFLAGGLILLQLRPELNEIIMKRRINNIREALRESLKEKETAVNYVRGLYEKSDVEGKKQLAYVLGAGFYHEQMKKKSEEKQKIK
ncbi:MAG: hypothetical protein Q8L29_01240 [archaeon]|nr:hypothetical protein [archaeon]